MVVHWEGSVKKGGDVKRWSLRKSGGIEIAIERQCKWNDKANEMIINKLCKFYAFY